jgi:RNA polymerase sigma factor (sigma-70 family)
MQQQDFFTFQERNFDAFCKKIINNLSAYALRKSINTLKRNQTMDDSIIQEIASAQVEDDYHVYGRTFTVRGISLVVRDEEMGECLQFIPPDKRAVLLLSYFGDFSDAEVARILDISNATVSYRKKDALRRLRALMEAMNHEK